MSRQLLPPDHVRLPASVVYDQAISDGSFRLYAVLRGLAWGKSETPPVSLEQMTDLTGMKRSSLYGHMRVLELRASLSWRAATTATFIFSFGDADQDGQAASVQKSGQSRNLDSPPPIKSISSKESKILKHSPVQKNGQSRNLDNAPPATTRAITDAYVALLGYDPGTWAQGEGQAAKWIGEHYTVTQFTEAYQHYKAETFWKDKRISLRYLKTNMGDYLGNGNGHSKSLTVSEAEELNRQLNPRKTP